MIAAIHAQWLILRRRPLFWSLAVAHLLLLAGQFLLPILVLSSADQLNSMTPQGEPAAFTPALMDQIRRQAVFPGALATIFGQINGIGGLLLMVLCGAFVGSDYSWGTLRTQLVRRPSRVRYLLAKVGALVLLAVLLVLVTLGVGLLLGMLNSVLLAEPGHISAEHWAQVGLGCLRSLFGLLPYMLLAVACAVAGRSALAGVAGSLLLWVLEVALGFLSILRQAGEAGKTIYNLTLSQNVGSLTEQTRAAFGLGVGDAAATGGFDLTFPSPGRAVALLLVYCAFLLGWSIWLLRRRDVMGPV